MELEVLEKRENPLLDREEIKVRIKSDKTPSRKEVKELVTAKLGTSPELTLIRTIKNKAGTRNFDVEVFVYKNPSVMNVVERTYMLKRNGVIEDEAQAQ
jgi:ribosomal protein S24E